jgi:hypothetical protein
MQNIIHDMNNMHNVCSLQDKHNMQKKYAKNAIHKQYMSVNMTIIHMQNMKKRMQKDMQKDMPKKYAEYANNTCTSMQLENM